MEIEEGLVDDHGPRHNYMITCFFVVSILLICILTQLLILRQNDTLSENLTRKILEASLNRIRTFLGTKFSFFEKITKEDALIAGQGVIDPACFDNGSYDSNLSNWVPFVDWESTMDYCYIHASYDRRYIERVLARTEFREDLRVSLTKTSDGRLFAVSPDAPTKSARFQWYLPNYTFVNRFIFSVNWSNNLDLFGPTIREYTPGNPMIHSEYLEAIQLPQSGIVWGVNNRKPGKIRVVEVGKEIRMSASSPFFDRNGHLKGVFTNGIAMNWAETFFSDFHPEFGDLLVFIISNDGGLLASSAPGVVKDLVEWNPEINQTVLKSWLRCSDPAINNSVIVSTCEYLLRRFGSYENIDHHGLLEKVELTENHNFLVATTRPDPTLTSASKHWIVAMVLSDASVDEFNDELLDSLHKVNVRVIALIAALLIGVWIPIVIGITRPMQKKLRLEHDLVKISEEKRDFQMEFVSSWSHELRTPLFAILGTLEMNEETTPTRGMIERSALTLLHLVNDVLDHSKMEAGKLELDLSPVNPETIVEDAVLIVNEIAKQKNIEICAMIRSNVPNTIRGDSLRLRQIILNYLSNAVKFASSQITVYIESISEDFLKVVVTDDGPGFSYEEKEKLFKRFQQTQGMTKKAGGTGLGLSICSKLATLMNGEVGAESDGESGATFWFTFRASPIEINESIDLPLTPREGSIHFTDRSSIANQMIIPFEDGPDNSPNVDPTDRPILIVDDNKVNRSIILKMLEKIDPSLLCVAHEDGQKAVEFYQEHSKNTSLILMDLSMPVMDGITATKSIRTFEAEKGLSPVPIIAITAHAFPSEKEQCFAAGMDDFLSKPFKTNELDSLIKKHNKS